MMDFLNPRPDPEPMARQLPYRSSVFKNNLGNETQ
jgi:hypothetical protein